jgi:hypothetical protein
MGFSISWLAVRTDDLDRLFEMAGVTPTAESDEWLESEFSGSGLQDGWYFFQALGCDHPIISGDSLSQISTLGETVACSVEEHVMVSIAEGWCDGARSWKIAHNAQEGMFDLSADGELPAHFDAIKDDFVSQQNAEGGEDAGVDFIFDIPLRVAKKICGYKHDEGSPPWMPPGPVAFTQTGASKAL